MGCQTFFSPVRRGDQTVFSPIRGGSDIFFTCPRGGSNFFFNIFGFTPIGLQGFYWYVPNSVNFQARTSRFRIGVDLHNTYNMILIKMMIMMMMMMMIMMMKMMKMIIDLTQAILKL